VDAVDALVAEEAVEADVPVVVALVGKNLAVVSSKVKIQETKRMAKATEIIFDIFLV